MGACHHCRSTILFGGFGQGPHRYCSSKCLEDGGRLETLPGVSDEAVDAEAREIRAGECGKCGGPGPVEAHPAYRVTSFLLVTSWRRTAHIGCRPCGRKEQAKDLLLSFLFGWWGFPWGIFVTPVQLVRGAFALASGTPDEEAPPSEMLLESARYRLAQRAVADAILSQCEEMPAPEAELVDVA